MESSIFDLFAHLGATEEQLDFPVLYASARQVRIQKLVLRVLVTRLMLKLRAIQIYLYHALKTLRGHSSQLDILPENVCHN